MTKRLLAALALFTLVLLALGTTVASAQTVTIGNTFSAVLCGTAYAVQTDNSAYVVPAGNWRVTSWSTQAGPDGGSMNLMVFLPTATPGTFTVVGESPVESLTANTLNTFTLTSPIAVQPGDLLGLWSTDADCADFGGGVVPFDFVSTPPPVGATLTPPLTQDLHLNISAVLSPALPTMKDECKHGGWQSFDVFKNQGDCVSFVATGEKNPPAG